MYEEVVYHGRRGSRTEAPNLGVRSLAGKQHDRIHSIRNTLMAANVPLASARSMQQSANKVSETITYLNKQDMATQRKHLHDINEALGLGQDAPIRAKGEGHYNNQLRSGGGATPIQPATQAVNTIIENVTKSKKIIKCKHSK